MLDDASQSLSSKLGGVWSEAACISHNGQQVAFGKGQWLEVVRLDGTEGLRTQGLRRTACKGEEAICALCWVAFQGALGTSGRGPGGALLLGTSLGFLQLHDARGALLHRQRLHGKSCQKIHVRTSGMGLRPFDEQEDVTLVFSDAIVRISSSQLQALLLQAPSLPDQGVASNLSLAFTKWDLPRSAGPRSDALCLGGKPPGLYDVMAKQRVGQKLLLLTTGRSPAIAGYEAQEAGGEGALQMVSELASTVATSVSGFARNVVKGRPDGLRAGVRSWLKPYHAAESEAGLKADKVAVPTGESCTILRSLPDEPRYVTSLSVAPRGSLAVAGDSFGRVLLIDVATLTLIRLWKSYRHVQAAWLLQPCTAEHDRQDQARLLLALFAPKRACVEIWLPRLGPRLCSIPCTRKAMLLSPSRAFGCHCGSSSSQTAWLLDLGAGTVVDVLAATGLTSAEVPFS